MQANCGRNSGSQTLPEDDDLVVCDSYIANNVVCKCYAVGYNTRLGRCTGGLAKSMIVDCEDVSMRLGDQRTVGVSPPPLSYVARVAMD